LQVENSSATPGGTGSFDVVLINTSGTGQVSGFSVELSVAANSGVKFTGATGSTTAAPYIFGTVQSSPLSFGPFPAPNFTTSDSDMTSPGSVTMTLSLEHVSYSMATGAPLGPVTVSKRGGYQHRDL
jgi:hypothetical protein